MISALMGGVLVSCTDEYDVPQVNNQTQDFGIGFRCTEMVETFYGSHNPASRASDNKATEEKEIKSIHIFFFDKAGKLLEPADYDNFTSYIYREKGEEANPSFISIPFKDNGSGGNEMTLFKEMPADGIVKVIAIANIDAIDAADGVNRFKTCYEGNPSGDIRQAGRSETKFNSDEPNPVLEVSSIEDLEKWIYYPPIRMSEDGISGDISSLPASGMPMIGELELNLNEKPKETPIVKMTALMAKVNVSIDLNPDQFTSQYPVLTITEYGVRNMPIAVPFDMPDGKLKSGKTAPKPTSAPAGFEYKDYIDTYNVTDVPVYHRTDVSALPSDPFHVECEDAAHEFTTKVNVTINKDSEPITFSYYTFENINLPNYASKLADGSPAFDDNLKPKYPTKSDGITQAIKNEDKQRWKSTFAYSDRASALILKGRYTTHQGISYNAEFTIYMGADADIDFQVKRNHQYDNNIVIHGLDYIRNSADDVYNFDGRVNVYDTDNPLYLAIVNERKVDAHASALPMDVWLMLRENGTYQQETPEVDHYTEVKFTIPEEEENWIQMVLIPREEMEEKDEAGRIFTAGRGAEKYFYRYLISDIQSGKVLQAGAENGAYYGHKLGVHNQVTGEVVEKVTINNKEYPVGAQCGREVTVFSTPGANGGDINNSRSRIYFYIDENVDEPLDDRTVHVRVDYKSWKLDDSGNEIDVRTLTRYVDIEQRGLLKVEGEWSNGTSTEKIPETYMEYYEEYLDHNDPLDRHEQPGEYYTGLQWGFIGQYLWPSIQNMFNNPESGNLNSQISYRQGGFALTNYVVGNANNGLRDNHLFNEVPPASIFHYCYGKNRRDYNGNPDVTYNNNYSTAKGWYTPGIHELEKAIVDYYGLFPEFRGNWYWSASAAREGSFLGIPTSGATYSRATQVTVNGTTPTFIESETSGTPGYHRRDLYHRVRSFYRKN